MTKDIIGQKVKSIMIMVELENGKAIIGKPTKIGNIDGLVTMKDLQRLMSNDEAPDDMKFMSPFVFVMDLQDAAKKWLKESRACTCLGAYWQEDNIENAVAFNEGIEWFCKHFFNLRDEE